MSLGKIGGWFEMRFLLVSLAPLSEAFLLSLFRRTIRISVAGIQEIHGLKCVCSAFYEAAPPHWESWIPSSSCVHDLKREHKGEKKSALCYEKD